MDVIKNAKALCKEIRRSLGNYPKATKVRLDDGDCGLVIAVRYHTTDVVRCFLDDTGSKVLSVVLDSGGWESKTTAERMESVLRFLETGYLVCHKRPSTKGVPAFEFTPYGVRHPRHELTYGKGTLTLVTPWTEGDDPKGTGAKGMLRTELPFEDQMCLTRKGKRFVVERPTKAEQRKLAKVVFSKFSEKGIQRRAQYEADMAEMDATPVDDPPVCPYCKSDDHASYNCEERHR